MGKIHVLDTETSNKIAAGEVVERPASVIKELAENSIDAGASTITVEIKNGGVTYMRVTDNGSGMSAEDAKICFLRHATSKISTGSDLDAIYTLGFRGEALSSIGAVAKVSLYTKRHEDETGVCVTCNGGEIMSAEDAGTPDGTTIVVEDLFYNTPARLKFLKKDATEAGYITDVVTRLVFAHPEISFRLIVNGKEKIFSAGDNNLQNAVYTIYGKDYAKNTIVVESEPGEIQVNGLIGKGTVSTSKRTHQSFFVNHRYIKSPIMIHALEEAYKNQVMIGKFPFAILNLEINPEMVDINVHPTKLEVKFSNEKDIYSAVYYAVKNALYAIPNVPKIERTQEPVFKSDNKKEQLNLADLSESLKKNYSGNGFDTSRETYIPRSMTKRPETPLYNASKNPFIKSESDILNDNVYEKSFNNKYDQLLKDDISNVKLSDYASDSESVLSKESYKEKVQSEIIENNTIDHKEDEKEEVNVFVDEYFEIIGQIFDTYIIAEKGDEMMIIDQHAAHERLKYEELKREIEAKQPNSQILIEPVVISLNGSEMSAFSENKETFNEMGFECEEFGEESIIVRAVPGGIEIGEVEPVMSELIYQAENLKKELISDKKQCIMYSIACKSAVKANMRLSMDEMKSLVRSVLRLENINTCPHGRPIIITMSKKELEKEFKRIV
jgi:DNA mismatch repair protein MutL